MRYGKTLLPACLGALLFASQAASAQATDPKKVLVATVPTRSAWCAASPIHSMSSTCSSTPRAAPWPMRAAVRTR
jgi:hypothetical protein